MADEQNEIPRRQFVSLSVAAGVAAATGSAAALEVVETEVEIKTPDGICDAAFLHPRSGAHAGVLIWPDAFGLRPSMRAIGRRIAAEGYTVLVPNPFYRFGKPPYTDASGFNFQNPADMARLRPLMASASAPGNPEKDATAFVAFLDAQKNIDAPRRTRRHENAGLDVGFPKCKLEELEASGQRTHW